MCINSIYIQYLANDLNAAFCPEKTFGIETVKCWMHKLNNFLGIFNVETGQDFHYFDLWITFSELSSSKIPKTNFKYAMDPTVLATNTNRMALTYLSQCAVYFNLESVKQWWRSNDPGNATFVEFVSKEQDVLFIGNLSILLSEVCF